MSNGHLLDNSAAALLRSDCPCDEGDEGIKFLSSSEIIRAQLAVSAPQVVFTEDERYDIEGDVTQRPVQISEGAQKKDVLDELFYAGGDRADVRDNALTKRTVTRIKDMAQAGACFRVFRAMLRQEPFLLSSAASIRPEKFEDWEIRANPWRVSGLRILLNDALLAIPRRRRRGLLEKAYVYDSSLTFLTRAPRGLVSYGRPTLVTDAAETSADEAFWTQMREAVCFAAIGSDSAVAVVAQRIENDRVEITMSSVEVDGADIFDPDECWVTKDVMLSIFGCNGSEEP
ncbi:hypothetical protein [Parvularcula marina]|uniref:hypothetical protein n=1 Tax=Parvularcula marina TaxID=2292771 RepID=UPI003512C2A7